MAKRKAKNLKMPKQTAPMPLAAMANTVPAPKPKVMPKAPAPMQPNHPRLAQAKRLNNNMTRAMAGRKRGG